MLCFPWKTRGKKSIKKYDKWGWWKNKRERKCLKTKSIIEFDPSFTCSITSVTVKKMMKENQRRDFLLVKF